MRMYWRWSCSVFVRNNLEESEFQKFVTALKCNRKFLPRNIPTKLGTLPTKPGDERIVESVQIRRDYALILPWRDYRISCLNYYMLWLQLLLTFIIGDCTFPIIAKSLSGPIGDVQWLRGGHCCWLAGYRRRRRSNVLTILDFKWVVLMFLSSALLAW